MTLKFHASRAEREGSLDPVDEALLNRLHHRQDKVREVYREFLKNQGIKKF